MPQGFGGNGGKIKKNRKEKKPSSLVLQNEFFSGGVILRQACKRRIQHLLCADLSSTTFLYFLINHSCSLNCHSQHSQFHSFYKKYVFTKH